MVRFIGIFVFVALAACSGVTLEGAKKLATSGQSVANSTSDLIAIPQNQMESYLEGLYLAAPVPPPAPAGGPKGCNPHALTAPSPAMLTDARKVAELYGYQSVVFRELSKAYAAFGALASYDAAGEVESGLKGLNQAANNYISAVDPTAPTIPDNISGVISGIGGAFASEIQKSKIRSASGLLRERIERLVPAFQQHWVHRAYVNVRTMQIQTGYEVASVMWCIGLADAGPIIRPFIEGYGLSIPARRTGPLATYRASYENGVANVLKSRSESSAKAVDAAYGEAMSALQNLITEHKKLEAGEPVTAENLAEQIKRIRVLVEAATAAK